LGILGFLTKAHFFKTGEHLAKPTVIDRVETVRNHNVGNGMEGNALGLSKRVHYTNYFKEFILSNHSSNN
jgi:hypothetical protein